MLFTKQRKPPQLRLEIGNQQIPFKIGYKYLGVVFKTNYDYNVITTVIIILQKM